MVDLHQSQGQRDTFLVIPSKNHLSFIHNYGISSIFFLPLDFLLLPNPEKIPPLDFASGAAGVEGSSLSNSSRLLPGKCRRKERCIFTIVLNFSGFALRSRLTSRSESDRVRLDTDILSLSSLKIDKHWQVKITISSTGSSNITFIV